MAQKRSQKSAPKFNDVVVRIELLTQKRNRKTGECFFSAKEKIRLNPELPILEKAVAQAIEQGGHQFWDVSLEQGDKLIADLEKALDRAQKVRGAAKNDAVYGAATRLGKVKGMFSYLRGWGAVTRVQLVAYPRS